MLFEFLLVKFYSRQAVGQRHLQTEEEHESSQNTRPSWKTLKIIGDESNNTVDPLETSLSRFYKGRVISLVAGWFGEIGRDFERTITTLPKEATASNFGRTLSPLINTERKGGTFPIMLQQFRRAIGVQVVRGNAMLKISRLHIELTQATTDACSSWIWLIPTVQEWARFPNEWMVNWLDVTSRVMPNTANTIKVTTIYQYIPTS